MSLCLDLLCFAGAPLSESDLKPLEDMGMEIRNWILQRSQKATAVVDVNADADSQHNTQHFVSDNRLAIGLSNGTTPATAAAAAATTVTDLYDF